MNSKSLSKEDAIYSEIAGEKFEVIDNQCYGSRVSSTANKSSNELGYSSKKQKLTLALIFLLLLVLLLLISATCIAFAVEIDKSKSETASTQMDSSLQQQQTSANLAENIANMTQHLYQEIVRINASMSQQLITLINMVSMAFGERLNS